MRLIMYFSFRYYKFVFQSKGFLFKIKFAGVETRVFTAQGCSWPRENSW